MENSPSLIYVMNPLSVWCYGFSSSIQQARKQFGSFIQFGMVFQIENTTPHIKSAQDADRLELLFENVKRKTGYTVHPRTTELFKSLGSNSDRSLWASKVLFAYRQSGGLEMFDMATLLQSLVFEEGMDPGSEEIYELMLERFPIIGTSLETILKDRKLSSQLKDESEMMFKYGTECPSLYLQYGETIIPVSTGYEKAQTVIQSIRDLLDQHRVFSC